MTPSYGSGNATFLAAGGEEGVRRLVDDFYDEMERNPSFATIRSWHPDDLAMSRNKLATFLCGWMGGPRRYAETFGPINIPQAHAHLPVTGAEREQWLGCMAIALDGQGYPESLVAYLLQQLAVPARAIEGRCARGIARD